MCADCTNESKWIKHTRCGVIVFHGHSCSHCTEKKLKKHFVIFNQPPHCVSVQIVTSFRSSAHDTASIARYRPSGANGSERVPDCTRRSWVMSRCGRTAGDDRYIGFWCFYGCWQKHAVTLLFCNVGLVIWALHCEMHLMVRAVCYLDHWDCKNGLTELGSNPLHVIWIA